MAVTPIISEIKIGSDLSTEALANDVPILMGLGESGAMPLKVMRALAEVVATLEAATVDFTLIANGDAFRLSLSVNTPQEGLAETENASTQEVSARRLLDEERHHLSSKITPYERAALLYFGKILESENRGVSKSELGAELGFDEQRSRAVFQNLAAFGLIDYSKRRNPPLNNLTELGILAASDKSLMSRRVPSGHEIQGTMDKSNAYSVLLQYLADQSSEWIAVSAVEAALEKERNAVNMLSAKLFSAGYLDRSVKDSELCFRLVDAVKEKIKSSDAV